MAPEESSKCLLKNRNPFGERSLFRDKVFHCTVIWSLPLQKAKISFQIYQFIWHVLNKRTSCFTLKVLFVDRKVNTWPVAFLTINYERIP